MKSLGIFVLFVLCTVGASAQNPNPDDSETVAAFRAAIHNRYSRLQAFYDATVSSMTTYRLTHVSNMFENYHELMSEFATSIEAIRARSGEQPEGNNAINGCARRANATLTDTITRYFYPTFHSVQTETSTIPLLTLSALSRGNVFDNNQDILDYLESQYNVLVAKWLNTVSQLFRWDKNRSNITGRFYVEEMNKCLCELIAEGRRCPSEHMPTLQA